MTKAIRCRRCSKVVEVPNDYEFKTCEICREKDKADRRVKSEVKKSEQKLVKDLKIDKARMPPMLWSYKNYCDSLGQYWHTKPTYEEYKRKVKEWKKQQIIMEADIEIMRRKREREALNDPWERPNFLGRDRDKMAEALARRERGMTTVDPELVREILEAPEHPVKDEEMSESDKRIQRFFKEQMAENEEAEQETEQNSEEKSEENEKSEN